MPTALLAHTMKQTVRQDLAQLVVDMMMLRIVTKQMLVTTYYQQIAQYNALLAPTAQVAQAISSSALKIITAQLVAAGK